MTNQNGSNPPETKSVIEIPEEVSSRNPIPPSYDGTSVFWFASQFADEVAPWGARHKYRDAQLRNFILQENIFASALGIICSRNAGFSWKLDGPQRTVSQLQYKFETANMGKGWHDLITKTVIDMSTQDNGAFWEIVREKDRADSPFLTVNHLDAARCWHTGNPKTPVVYLDRLGKYHLLKWYNVIEFAEMPASIEQLGYYGLQYSTLTRLLRKLQTSVNIGTYDYERTGGRNTRAVHMVKGITTQQLTDAISSAKAGADNAGLTRYMNPVLVGTLDPKADVGHDTIDLVSTPDKYDPDIAFNQYIAIISMAFSSDYQEFAPLPGNNLGTGSQSEMLHLKSRGKGPGTFMKLITQAINYHIVPRNVRFFFDEQDLEAEKSTADVKAIRAQTRAVRIASGEITPQVARQIANDDGDLALEFIHLMAEEDVTPDITVRSDQTPESQIPQSPITPGNPAPDAPPDVRTQRANTDRVHHPPAQIPSIRPPTPLSAKLPPTAREKSVDPTKLIDPTKLLDFLADPNNRLRETAEDDAGN